MMHLRESDDPQVEDALRFFVAVDSDMMDLSAETLPYMTKSLAEETIRRIDKLEMSCREQAHQAAAKFIAIFDNEELAKRVARILNEAWDPAGVSNLPSGRGFYDEYVSEIRELLRVEATERELVDHLLRIEDGTLKFPIDRPRALNVARLLIESAAEFRLRPSANLG